MKLNPKLFIDVIFPIGTSYITNNPNFNPNTAWGGTWVKDCEGQTIVGQKENDSDFGTLDDVVGEKTHQHLTALFSQSESGAGGDVAVNWNGTQYGIGSAETIKEGAWDKISTQGTAGNKTGYPYKTSDESSLQPSKIKIIWTRTA